MAGEYGLQWLRLIELFRTKHKRWEQNQKTTLISQKWTVTLTADSEFMQRPKGNFSLVSLVERIIIIYKGQLTTPLARHRFCQVHPSF